MRLAKSLCVTSQKQHKQPLIQYSKKGLFKSFVLRVPFEGNSCLTKGMLKKLFLNRNINLFLTNQRTNETSQDKIYLIERRQPIQIPHARSTNNILRLTTSRKRKEIAYYQTQLFCNKSNWAFFVLRLFPLGQGSSKVQL